MSSRNLPLRRLALALTGVLLLAAVAWTVHSTVTHPVPKALPPDAVVEFFPNDRQFEWGNPLDRSCGAGDCPIVLDLGGEGIELTRPEDGVWFDLDADGTPEQVAWTQPGSEIAFLALDRIANGRVDSGMELFGNRTPMPPDATEANGWEMLRHYDATFGNGDGQLSAEDSLIWDALWLWRDRNHNGLSEAGELSALADSPVRALRLDYREVRTVDRNGNETRYRAEVSLAPSRGAGAPPPALATEVILRASGAPRPADG